MRRGYLPYEPRRESGENKTEEEKAQIEKEYTTKLENWKKWKRHVDALVEKTKGGPREFKIMSKIGHFREKFGYAWLHKHGSAKENDNINLVEGMLSVEVCVNYV